MCQSFRAIILRFNSKTQWQLFLLLYGRHVCVPQKDRNMTSPYKAKFGWHTSANNARMKNSREAILGKVVYISIIYRISDSWLLSFNGYDFYFDHMTGENREVLAYFVRYRCPLTSVWFENISRMQLEINGFYIRTGYSILSIIILINRCLTCALLWCQALSGRARKKKGLRLLFPSPKLILLFLRAIDSASATPTFTAEQSTVEASVFVKYNNRNLHNNLGFYVRVIIFQN